MNSSSQANEELTRRLEKWRELTMQYSSTPDSILLSGVRVLGQITNTYFQTDYGKSLTIDSKTADEIIQGSTLITQLKRDLPALAEFSPKTSQLWVGNREPTEAILNNSNEKIWLGKPHGRVLYTSTLIKEPDMSMWKLYLENQGGTLFPKPWKTYQLKVKQPIKVYDITSAEKWTELIKTNYRREGDLLYPNWESIARHYDGVHMTLPAIFAIQGFRLWLDNAEIVETYWDVESSIWFSWAFEDTAEVG